MVLVKYYFGKPLLAVDLGFACDHIYYHSRNYTAFVVTDGLEVRVQHRLDHYIWTRILNYFNVFSPNSFIHEYIVSGRTKNM